MKAEEKIARQRLSVLQLAETLDNVSEACRQRGMTRTQFYGFEGLKDLPPIHKTHPQTTPPEVVARILELALTHPSKGCKYISDLLRLEGRYVSGPTVQSILDKHELGTRFQRLLKLEQQHLEAGIELTPEQIQAIEKANPVFRERHVESARPGELLSADTFLVGHFKGIGKVYLHAVVDTYGSYGFGFLHTSKQPQAAAALLHNDVLPFYADHNLTVQAVLTDNGREFCGTDTHPYELYLALNDIEHRRTRVRTPRTNGFVERFQRTVLEEFFVQTLRTTFYETVEALQADLDTWLRFYNIERPHQGYRNMGRRPYDTVQLYLQSVTIEG